jgi:hypothetical protein
MGHDLPESFLDPRAEKGRLQPERERSASEKRRECHEMARLRPLTSPQLRSTESPVSLSAEILGGPLSPLLHSLARVERCGCGGWHGRRTMPNRNRGHIVGQKPPLKPREVWSIRTRLQVSGAERDLALFNLAIDSKLRGSKLRGCDLVTITVSDIALSGVVRDRAVIVQRKTGRPVQFEITEQTRAAVGAWITRRGLTERDYLFQVAYGRNRTCRQGNMEGLSTNGFRASGSTRSGMEHIP